MNGLERFKSRRYRADNSASAPIKPRAAVSAQRKCFVVVPCMWVDRLLHAKHLVIYKVALHLLYEAWRTKKSVVSLSTVALANKNISRASKDRALSELARLGLVEIERHRGRSPRVRMLHTD